MDNSTSHANKPVAPMDTDAIIPTVLSKDLTARKPSRKRKMKQTKFIAFRTDEGSSPSVAGTGTLVVDVTTVATSNNEDFPSWVTNLLKDFNYVGSERRSADNRKVFNLVCRRCILAKPDSQTKGISGKCATSFIRHLQVR